MKQNEDSRDTVPCPARTQQPETIPRRTFLAETVALSAVVSTFLSKSDASARAKEAEATSTAERLVSQFNSHAQVAGKYAAFAVQAAGEGRPQTASLFRALAMAETFHAEWLLRQMNGVAATADNLKGAAGFVASLSGKVLPAAAAQARREKEAAAERLFEKLAGACVEHEKVLRQARDRILAGHDTDPLPIRICPDCGSVFVLGAPDKCPVCGASGAKFLDAP